MRVTMYNEEPMYNGKPIKVNLYQEILKCLEKHGYSIQDIDWAGSCGVYYDIETFLKLALETNYSNWWGMPKINKDLIICGKDFWMTRFDYGVREAFEFHKMPIKPLQQARAIRLLERVDGYSGTYDSYGYQPR